MGTILRKPSNILLFCEYTLLLVYQWAVYWACNNTKIINQSKFDILDHEDEDVWLMTALYWNRVSGIIVFPVFYKLQYSMTSNSVVVMVLLYHIYLPHTTPVFETAGPSKDPLRILWEHYSRHNFQLHLWPDVNEEWLQCVKAIHSSARV